MPALFLAFALAISSAALAQPGSGEPGGGARAAQFAALDRNADGYVTREFAKMKYGYEVKP